MRWDTLADVHRVSENHCLRAANDKMLDLATALVRLLPLAGFAVAAPSSWSPFRRQASGDQACAQIAQAYDEARADRTTGVARVKPSLAYQCLRSIPVDVDRDVAFVKYIRPWLEFQSTVGILPNPPEEYLYPGVDIFGGLNNITQSLQNGGYASQIDFGVDLYRLINVKPRDGHLGYTPRVVTLIRFETPEIFISISEDGLKAPKVYLYRDYRLSKQQGYTPSEVAKFDNVAITDYIQQRSVDNSRNQDPDAAYNEQLFSAVMNNIGETGGAGRHIHTTLPDQSVIEFANGTRTIITNIAYVTSNFSGIRTGEDVHRRFEVPGRDGEAEVPVNTTRATFIPALEGYPEPFVIHRDRYQSGYFMNGSEYSDVAVIAVNSFVTQNQARRSLAGDPLEFIRVTSTFVERSRRQRRSKLIIDLQGNGGGLVVNVMTLYATLFPEGGDKAHMNMRVRAHAALNWVGTTAEKLGVDLQDLPYPVGFNGFVDVNFRNFTTWESFYGPKTLDGEEYSNIVQPLEISYAADGVPGEFDIPEPWFKPEDTIIVTDGYCASACAYAVGMMTRELGIQVVAVGGRPLEAPMQAIGGTKGGPVLSLSPYQRLYPALSAFATPPDNIDLTPFENPNPPLAGPPTSSWAINSANIYLDDDLEGTPVQFRYEAAHCKVYYTWDTLTDLRRLWETVANVKWNGGKCVKGSTTNDDGTIGKSAPGYSDKVVSNFKWSPGPGDVVEGANRGTGGGNGTGNGGDGNQDKGNAASSAKASWSVMSIVTAATILVFVM
ncbi:peptidase S41 family protein [Colletotrichum truncatum]|uniref:Peptidase S41 family protein n=1 Tax=Colletotrichum truncatum TaxID=5467 RepID=A0ACC3YHE2_COLTU|nr:peptidase S41 family protein [Colletotrichum truncatum]KAF6792859.1 peptidase S41 family protein [Colletotrichum truncatum]